MGAYLAGLVRKVGVPSLVLSSLDIEFEEGCGKPEDIIAVVARTLTGGRPR